MVAPYNDLNTTSNYIYGRFNVQYVISLSTHYTEGYNGSKTDKSAIGNVWVRYTFFVKSQHS